MLSFSKQLAIDIEVRSTVEWNSVFEEQRKYSTYAFRNHYEGPELFSKTLLMGRI